jgi:tRNA1Val (adenine37-N6)-methyltransferase
MSEQLFSENHQRFLDRKPSFEAEFGEPLTVSGLVGPYRIFQRAKGHRHSIDDSTTAWYALQKAPPCKSALDLGTGIGTVGLAVLWGLGEGAKLTCIEAQQISYTLLKENILCNQLSEQVEAHFGDLRDLSLGRKFSLITGSPPYFPADAGIIPSDSQKAHARFELRGHVGDYAAAAKRHLAEDGVFVYCFPAQQKQRGIALVTEQGFSVVTMKDVIPAPGKAPLFSLYSAKLGAGLPLIEEPSLLVTHADGSYTEEMNALQASRGFGPPGSNRLG